jgi:hypothetical protein
VFEPHAPTYTSSAEAAAVHVALLDDPARLIAPARVQRAASRLMGYVRGREPRGAA